MGRKTGSSTPSILARLSGGFGALRHRNFQLFFGGQLISLVGTWMQMVALSWLVYRMTGSSLLLGTVSFVSQIPIFLLAPVGGIVADRYRRHSVVVVTQTAAMILAFILAGLTLGGVVRVWHVMVLAGLSGAVFAFDMPARQSLFKELVGHSDLMNAIALNSLIFNLARVVGPAIAGVLVASIGEGWCFLGNAVSFLAVIAGLLMMRLPASGAMPAKESVGAVLREGFDYVRRTRTIRDLLLLIGFAGLVAMPFSVLMPIFAADILHGGARALGTLMCATGVGALASALAMALRRSLKNISIWVTAAAIGFGLSLTAFSLSHHFWLSAALLVPVGFGTMLHLVATNTLIQSMVPDRLRGRVLSFYSMISIGMAPFGAFIAGACAERWGAPLTVGVGGLACAAGGLVFATQLRGFRVEARRLIHEQQAANKVEAPMVAPGGMVPLEPMEGPVQTD